LRAVLDLLVGKPQNPESLPGQPDVPPHVGSAIFVLGTVGLDDQPVPEADEIDDVSADRELTAELEILQPAVAQEFPEAAFVEDGFMPHLPSALSEPFVHRLF
jgi:hypothetical protein